MTIMALPVYDNVYLHRYPRVEGSGCTSVKRVSLLGIHDLASDFAILYYLHTLAKY